jgi:hypothetical protein
MMEASDDTVEQQTRGCEGTVACSSGLRLGRLTTIPE